MPVLAGPASAALAGICAFAALFIAIYQMACHLRNYTNPVFQRFIVRIIFLVPLYSLLSFLSLLMEQNSVYFDTFRDCYEAFVVYTFLALCLAYVGGPGSVEVKMNGYQLHPSVLYCTCCLPALPVNGAFVRTCKRGALQFVWLKPVLAGLTVVLYTQHMYTEGYWGPNNGYLWITVVYNITYSIALYALVLFYLGTHDLLAPYNPLLKFALVKSVVFLTFWQGLFIAILTVAGVLKTVEDGKNLQNFLICVEMLPAALGMLYAFPYTEYKGAGPTAGIGLENMRHVISIHDVVSDTMHQFAPTYHDYVLYSNGGGKEAPKTVRAKTFVAVGHETANRDKRAAAGGKGEAMDADLLANMELGVHAANAGGLSPPGVSRGSPGAAAGGGGPDSPAGGSHGGEDLYYNGAALPDNDGIEMSSAPVPAAALGRGRRGRGLGRGVLRKETDDDEPTLASGAPAHLQTADFAPPSSHAS
ncbi:hypothetical protein WJX81_000927 [Elliptochloris bilobata]|uniref:Uncharacterized protein n=1 Tax=Elliptochloris bilobata TaxID=381761 RepID=A0AAW1SJR4_9CHLO